MFDPDKGAFFFMSGRKGSGKSVLARRVFDSYPYDKLVIDPTRDIRQDLRDEDVQFVELTEPMPTRFPKDPDGKPVTAVFVPDMGSPTAVDEMDRALGLCLRNGPSCCWIDEIGVMSQPGRTPPNLRRALHHGRHDKLTLIMAGPRPKDIDPLCIAQADERMTFDTPLPMDRQRIAQNIGWPEKDFDQAVFNLGEFEYLWHHQDDHTLTHMPKLPPRRRALPAGPVNQSVF